MAMGGDGRLELVEYIQVRDGLAGRQACVRHSRGRPTPPPRGGIQVFRGPHFPPPSLLLPCLQSAGGQKILTEGVLEDVVTMVQVRRQRGSVEPLGPLGLSEVAREGDKVSSGGPRSSPLSPPILRSTYSAACPPLRQPARAARRSRGALQAAATRARRSPSSTPPGRTSRWAVGGEGQQQQWGGERRVLLYPPHRLRPPLVISRPQVVYEFLLRFIVSPEVRRRPPDEEAAVLGRF